MGKRRKKAVKPYKERPKQYPCKVLSRSLNKIDGVELLYGDGEIIGITYKENNNYVYGASVVRDDKHITITPDLCVGKHKYLEKIIPLFKDYSIVGKRTAYVRYSCLDSIGREMVIKALSSSGYIHKPAKFYLVCCHLKNGNTLSRNNYNKHNPEYALMNEIEKKERELNSLYRQRSKRQGLT